MRFESLRIVGFKTFVDPVEVRIEPGLTGIVGPNGCGKSNLVEALRWVMGETSHKSMRGSGMDDVIFSGSGSRPSRNTAEVMLRIDNGDRTAPAAFNEAGTLEVSRRIEREEGSTYRINAREVRARDVQLLFADAASGARSPSLVRQGQIGEIIAAKPQARRRILEDAAGIAGLHARRHEAELRLKAADDNLTRLEDVLLHLDGQLEALKRQAKQAGRYRTIAARIRRAEALLHLVAIHEARLRLDAAGRQLDLDTRDVAQKTREQGEAARAQAVAEHELEPLRIEEARLGASLQRLQIARDGLEAEERRTRVRMTELDRRIAELDADLVRDRQLAGEAVDAAARLSAEDETLAAAQEKAASGEAGALAASEAADAMLRASETALEDMQAAFADRQARRAAAERAAKDADERLARAKRQAEAAIAEQNQLRQRATAPAAEREALAARLAESADALAAAEAALQEAERAHARLREEEFALRPGLAEAERVAQRLETEARTIAKLVAGETSDLWPAIVETISVAKGYETALGAALGDDLNASVEVTAPVHWRGIVGEASDLPHLPAGARPIAKYVGAPAVLGRRLSQIGIIERSLGPRLQSLLKPGQRLVSIEGDLWRWDGFHAAAEAPTAAAKRLAERNRLKEVERDAAAALEKRASLRKRAEAAIIAVRHAGNAETGVRTMVSVARKTVEGARQFLSDAERKAADLIARLDAIEETVARLGTASTEAARDAEAATAALSDAALAEDMERRLGEARAEAALQRGVAAEARAELSGLKREAEFRRSRRLAIEAEALAWKERAARAGSQEAERLTRIAEARKDRTELDETPARFAEQRRSLGNEIEAAEGARRAASDLKAEAETRFAELDRTAKRTLAELSSAREARAASEARLDAATLKLAETERFAIDQLDAAPAELRRLADLAAETALPQPGEIEAELQELKRERERIGAVNLQADDELAEVEASRGNLIAERDDLQEAIRRLRRGIESLNAEGRQRLTAAFDIVNGHFRRLFATLFGGGEANLTLIESDDPLEAGLEIIAKPPGKKPQVLTLLSGGEQALTASALIFAVFLTNPAPVCVLDEIDAPLDDANVERLCNLLDDMVKETETRFITITHNPITMARMDRLFGVTMAERGVSQIVSVDLTEAERLAELA